MCFNYWLIPKKMKGVLKNTRIINQLLISKVKIVSEIWRKSFAFGFLQGEFLRIGNAIGYSVIWEMSSVSQPESVLTWGTSTSAGFGTNEARSPAGFHLGQLTLISVEVSVPTEFFGIISIYRRGFPSKGGPLLCGSSDTWVMILCCSLSFRRE